VGADRFPISSEHKDIVSGFSKKLRRVVESFTLLGVTSSFLLKWLKVTYTHGT
jgi:hypothetical protein